MEGSQLVFLVTNYWEYASAETEFTQGKNVTDACVAAGVSRIIFSSLLHVREATNGRLSHVPHFDSKANVEKYIRQSGLNSTPISNVSALRPSLPSAPGSCASSSEGTAGLEGALRARPLTFFLFIVRALN